MGNRMLQNVFDTTPITTRAMVFAKYYNALRKSVHGGRSGERIRVPPKLRLHVAKLANSFGFNGPELFLDEPVMMVVKMQQEHKGWHPLTWKAGKISIEYVNVG